ncbi:MAG: hypothetical protein HQL64_13670 [Magnetococcales bacterium]|nr:hypothetical protein [Magnetococcales bacterium]
MSVSRLQSVRSFLMVRILAETALVGLIAALIRFLWVEPQAIGLLCQTDPPPWWCLLRQALGMAFHFRVFGTLAIVLAGAAHLFPGRTRTLGRLAMASGMLGLVFYNALGGAVGFVGGMLALVGEDSPSVAMAPSSRPET